MTDDEDDDTYQSLACITCTRVHLINLKTGKVLGEEEDRARPAAMLAPNETGWQVRKPRCNASA